MRDVVWAVITIANLAVVAWVMYRRGYRKGRQDVLDQIESTQKAKNIPYSGLFEYPPEG